jgi:hypothetical protein
MSTLEIGCGRCEKKFRVRAEFAGRSTRCPGCSAPITIAGAVLPPKPAEEERPRQRQRRRDDDDEEPRRPLADWAPVEAAFRREQWAVIFVFIGILGGLFSICAANLTRHTGEMEPALIFFVLLFGIGPPITTAAFGIMARGAALAAPKESFARGSARSSMVCAIAGIICLVIFALAMLASIGSNGPDPLPMIVSLAGAILSGLGAFATFLGFVAQVGIARRSAAVSQAIARISVTIAACLVSVLGIGFLYTMISEMTGPAYYYSRHEHEGFFSFVLGILLPLAFGVVLILYHRALAAGRQAVRGEERRRYDGD